MKRLIIALGLAGAIAFPAFGGETRTVKFFIPAMTGCPSCPYIVGSVLKRVDGVEAVRASYATGIATIVYDGAKAKPEDFVRALAQYGYDDGIKPVAPEG